MSIANQTRQHFQRNNNLIDFEGVMLRYLPDEPLQVGDTYLTGRNVELWLLTVKKLIPYQGESASLGIWAVVGEEHPYPFYYAECFKVEMVEDQIGDIEC